MNELLEAVKADLKKVNEYVSKDYCGTSEFTWQLERLYKSLDIYLNEIERRKKVC